MTTNRKLGLADLPAMYVVGTGAIQVLSNTTQRPIALKITALAINEFEAFSEGSFVNVTFPVYVGTSPETSPSGYTLKLAPNASGTLAVPPGQSLYIVRDSAQTVGLGADWPDAGWGGKLGSPPPPVLVLYVMASVDLA